jgi:hypothetical protein
MQDQERDVPMIDDNTEKRTCPRFDFPVPVEFKTGDENNDKVYKGVVVNISLPVECNTAAVLWSKKIDSRLYITGLKFLDQAGHPLSPLRFF